MGKNKIDINEDVNYKVLPWLTTVPASDQNFKINLEQANLRTLAEALHANNLTKTARQKIEAQFKKLGIEYAKEVIGKKVADEVDNRIFEELSK